MPIATMTISVKMKRRFWLMPALRALQLAALCADSDKGEVVVLDVDDNDNLIVKNGEVVYKTLHGSVDIDIKTAPL